SSYSFTRRHLEGQVAPSHSSTGLPSASIRRDWSLRDIPMAVRLAFDLEKLATAALGLTAAALAYGWLNWLGLITHQHAAHRVFAVLGAILANCICVLFSGLVARMATLQLLEERRIGAGELTQFARERWTTLIGIPLAFGGLAVLMLGIESIMA